MKSSGSYQHLSGIGETSKIRISIICWLAIPVLFSCTPRVTQADVSEIYEVEKAFSDMSVEEGMKAAFLYFSDDSAALLRPNRMPILGKDSIASYMAGLDDTRFTLSWEPLKAAISSSGDLGYSFGIYRIRSQADNAFLGEGTYVTIWKKNDKGDWRYVMDTGQEGLSE